MEAPARTAQPPDAVTVLTRVGDRLAVAFPPGGFKGTGVFFLIFSAIWNGITWVMLLAMLATKSTGGINLVGLLFLAPFVGIGLIAIGATIYCICGDAAIALDRTTILFERRLFGRKWTHTYDFTDVSDIRRTESYRQNNQPVYGIGIHFKSRKIPLTFGTALKDDEKAWLTGELYAYWKEQS